MIIKTHRNEALPRSAREKRKNDKHYNKNHKTADKNNMAKIHLKFNKI
ncbi:hypothetical protein KAJ61_00280 [Candidatus Parcubacteria bacterium]|nr:hypothetical protein [Candidatus Parcubacteria bacterium]